MNSELAESAFEVVQCVCKCTWQTDAEGGGMVANLRDCFAPAVNIYQRNCLYVGGEAFEYPFENSAVFAIARPHESPVFVAVEPVDKEDLWQFVGFGLSSNL